jgi:hypothetical protein
MILLFEEYNYSKSILDDVLKGYEYLCTELKENKSKVQYVGYFYSKEKSDSVFILPKVFIDENNRALSRYAPEEIVNAENILKNEEVDEKVRQSDYSVIYEHSVWIYRAISQYASRNKDNGIVKDVVLQNPKEANGEQSQTLIDIILKLIDFHKDHHHLFTYIAIINSSGNNKIHWPKTISRTQPIIKGNKPYYVEFKNKTEVIDFDEELIVLFYSTLKYLSAKYNFRIKSDIQYTLLSTRKIQDLIDSKTGTRLLKKISKKYFSDEFIKLWKLLYIFFEKSEKIKTGNVHNDKLLAKDFNRIFEDMVDFLISDDRKNLPKELYNQKDGKLVDHIYKDNSILDEERDIYYIGDSKYYKESTDYGPNSIYKQFTYAKNVIQYNINVFNNNDKVNIKNFRYRDPLTEGYDITPNFFINAELDFKNLEDVECNISKKKLEHENRHFFNRLFDRDTLFLQAYKINFLFVLKSYVTNVDHNVKVTLKKKIRKDFINFLEGQFDFYLLEPLNSTDNNVDVIEKHFKRLNGKIFKPSNSGNLLIMALEKRYVLDNFSLISIIKSDFKIYEYHLGRDVDIEKHEVISYDKKVADDGNKEEFNEKNQLKRNKYYENVNI